MCKLHNIFVAELYGPDLFIFGFNFSQDCETAEKRRWKQATYKATNECLYGVGQGWAAKDSKGLSWHA